MRDESDPQARRVRVARPSEGVAVVTLDSPPSNAFGREECRHFIEVWEALARDLEVRCVVLTGTGKAFTSGADLREQRALTPDAFEAYLDADDGLNGILGRVEAARFPVVAAVNGHAVGGGLELALRCDVRLASAEARFVCAGVNVGLILSWYRLPHVVGMGRAKEMLLSGASYDGATAERWGLVSGLFPPDELVPGAVRLAEQIASRAPLSVEATKACANRAFDLSAVEADELQRSMFLEMVATRDHDEALEAFVEKRRPRFERR
jgi:enoyl-CoA hydratase